MKNSYRLIICSLTCILLLGLWAHGRVGGGERAVFNAIPSPFRKQLENRLTLLVRLQAQENWTEVYKFLPSRDKAKENENAFRTRQIELTNWKLLNFQPTKIVSYSADTGNPKGPWNLLGCALILKNGKPVAYDGAVSLELEKGEWLMSIVSLTTELDGNPETCEFKESKGLLYKERNK